MIGDGCSGKVMKGYMSWGNYNIFLTPAYDWMHDCNGDCYTTLFRSPPIVGRADSVSQNQEGEELK